jgi:hypothetical protein
MLILLLGSGIMQKPPSPLWKLKICCPFVTSILKDSWMWTWCSFVVYINKNFTVNNAFQHTVICKMKHYNLLHTDVTSLGHITVIQWHFYMGWSSCNTPFFNFLCPPISTPPVSVPTCSPLSFMYLSTLCLPSDNWLTDITFSLLRLFKESYCCQHITCA